MDLFRTYVFLATIFSTGCTTINNEVEPGAIVSAHWLQLHQDDTSLVILHVGNREVFDTVHIPGSRPIDPEDFTVTKNELRNELPEVSAIVDLLRSAGVNMDSRILLYYDDKDLLVRTARIFMTLDYAGFGNRTFVLNGGLAGWIAEGGLVTEVTGHWPGKNGQRPVTMGDLKPGIPKEVIIRARELNLLLDDPDYTIIDSRSLDEYYGELDSIGLFAKGGHIEGAYFMNYKNLLSEPIPNRFRGNSDLLKQAEKAGMDRNKTAVFYCGSGMRASVNYLIARHLGYPALLYDGSYQEWERLSLPLTSPVIDPLNRD